METSTPVSNSVDSALADAPAVPEVKVNKFSIFFKKHRIAIIAGLLAGVLIIIAGVVFMVLTYSPSKKPVTDNILQQGDYNPSITGYVSATPAGSLTATPSVTTTAGASVSPSVTASASPTSTTFQVTAVNGSVDQPAPNTCAGTRATFSYQITTNRAGTVTYHYHRSDGSDGSPENLVFSAAGTQTVTTTWDRICPSGTCSGSMQLIVTAPNSISSTQVNNVITCNAADFSGTWYHNFGSAQLDQTGSTVSGTYFNGFSGDGGYIAGDVASNTLNGTWTKGGSGSLLWNKNGNQFSGNWSGGYSWCGARAGSNFPANCSFSGNWIIKLTDSDLCPGGNMNLTISISGTGVYDVSGTYCNGSVSGTVVFNNSTAVMNGTWYDSGGGSGSLQFWLVDGYNATQFQGHYSTAGLDYAWCGWRSGSSQPGTCLR